MLHNWLNRVNRTTRPYVFNVIDISEKAALDDDIKNYLGTEILEQYRNKSYLKRQFENEDIHKLINYIKNNVFPNIDRFPTNKQNQPAKNVRQGDFGEILTTLVIEKFFNLKVPISKLRYKFNNDRSMFCTDLISHNHGNVIMDLTYYEIKTKITYDDNIAKIAYDGLLKDEQKPTEGIADFLSRYYFEQAEAAEGSGGDATNFYDLADKFGDIVKNPEIYNRNFEIVLIIEKNVFKEVILENLNDISLQLSPLEITVILIDNLKELVNDVFDKAVDVAINHTFGSATIKHTPIVTS